MCVLLTLKTASKWKVHYDEESTLCVWFLPYILTLKTTFSQGAGFLFLFEEKYLIYFTVYPSIYLHSYPPVYVFIFIFVSMSVSTYLCSNIFNSVILKKKEGNKSCVLGVYVSRKLLLTYRIKLIFWLHI